MFYVKNPSARNKPWILSNKDDENVVSIPLEVAGLLSNYHIMAIEFLYRNYRKGMKGSILNGEVDMNYPLQVSGFFRGVIVGPALVLVICPRQSACFWDYHLTKHAEFEVVHVTTKNLKEPYDATKKVALLVCSDSLNLCDDLVESDFFSVVIEDFEQLAVKRVIKRLSGNFNIGLTSRSFYINPDQKLQWNMLNWANPGCVGKLNEFYAIDNENFDCFNDSYRFWWLRLTWQFCESFVKPTDEETEAYQKEVENWASENSPTFHGGQEKRTRKRKIKKPRSDTGQIDDCTKPVMSESSNDVPTEYVKLPSMDENPIVTSIIKNFEISPEAILGQRDLPYTQTQPSGFKRENSVILSFLKDEEKPSTSRSESEDFILNLI